MASYDSSSHTTTATEKAVLLMLLILGGVVALLSMTGYFTQRQQLGKDIKELKTDFEMHASQ